MIKSIFSSAHAWLRRNPLVLFATIVVYIAISKQFGVANTIVSKIFCFVLSAVAIHWIDKKLPRRRLRTLATILLLIAIIFITAAIYRFVIQQQPLGDEAWIFGILILISCGYGVYCLWRLHRLLLSYNEIRVRRGLRARCGRK